MARVQVHGGAAVLAMKGAAEGWRVTGSVAGIGVSTSLVQLHICRW